MRMLPGCAPGEAEALRRAGPCWKGPGFSYKGCGTPVEARHHSCYVLVAPGTGLEMSVASHYCQRKKSLYFPEELGKDLPWKGHIYDLRGQSHGHPRACLVHGPLGGGP